MRQSVTLLFIFIAAINPTFGQKSCRPGSKCKSTGRTTVVIPPSSVFIEVTDETNGRVVTYRKEFRIDHIPAHRREAYVEYLEDSILYSGTGSFRVAGEATRPKAAPVRRRAQPSQRLAGRR
ncbi:hypothetical protein GCM10023091_43350 [Ravibacter arvi]|uniref:Uncharacterized protein n=1 Tax=Ravibacter arvi TaxID=2051041 RepID=A0ABP8MDG1_9BACT